MYDKKKLQWTVCAHNHQFNILWSVNNWWIKYRSAFFKDEGLLPLYYYTCRSSENGYIFELLWESSENLIACAVLMCGYNNYAWEMEDW